MPLGDKRYGFFGCGPELPIAFKADCFSGNSPLGTELQLEHDGSNFTVSLVVGKNIANKNQPMLAIQDFSDVPAGEISYAGMMKAVGLYSSPLMQLLKSGGVNQNAITRNMLSDDQASELHFAPGAPVYLIADNNVLAELNNILEQKSVVFSAALKAFFDGEVSGVVFGR